MAAHEHHEHDDPHLQQELNDHHHYRKLLSSYLGVSFTLFLGFLPKNSIKLLSSLQSRNKALPFKLTKAEVQLKQLHSRRKEDSKANARVVEIFASHRHSWQQEEKRLLQQIDEGKDEISYLKGKVKDFERLEEELKGNFENLKREICERDEMLSFMSRRNSSGECNSGMGFDEKGGVYGFSSDFLNSAAFKFWAEKTSSWQDMQYESLESIYPSKHFVARRESPWKIDGNSNGVFSKLKFLSKNYRTSREATKQIYQKYDHKCVNKLRDIKH